MKKIKGLLLILGCLLVSCADQSKQESVATPKQPKQTNPQATTEIVEFLPGIHLAVGFGITNSLLIEGDSGNILIDTLESVESAAPLAARFNQLNEKGISHVVYLNHSISHCFGTSAFTLEENAQIIAHESTQALLEQEYNQLRRFTDRQVHQTYGSLLDPNIRRANSMGQKLEVGPQATPGFVKPNLHFQDKHTIKFKNRRVELIHTPGYSADQVSVWLPKEKLLICADNFYKAWPNLSGVGTIVAADIPGWIASIDHLRKLAPHHLIPSHGFPISGQATIEEYLTLYRDAIQFVHDQTLQALSRGEALEDIACELQLPKALQNSPVLKETFGTLPQSVMAIGRHYLQGNPQQASKLYTPSSLEHASRLADLAGGPEALFKKLRQAHRQGDDLWALELAEALTALNFQPNELKPLHDAILNRLATTTTDNQARHVYLTQQLDPLQRQRPLHKVEAAYLDQLSTESFLRFMAIHLDRHAAAEENRKVALSFTDTNEVFTIWVRHGIAEIQPEILPDWDLKLTGPASAWKHMLMGLESPTIELTRSFKIEGGTRVNIGFFLGLFKTQETKP